MRLFKMLAYALLGYAIYEFVRGMLEEPGSRGEFAARSADQSTRPHSDNSSGQSSQPATRTL
jgi:hypothetical protein